ncbi:coiled-coil domain-containing protein 152 isoform X2 [Haplochromis burtoni]|uniref:coiled-coil domain-containing protein 152 isoform X2 n=1 Tax=Haplochromis burtoni TaxID=8153 RepID=UPI0003BCF494|nr:coiled-coil domain-containing protein 152 isoform X2 [Haplochromis burtoni]
MTKLNCVNLEKFLEEFCQLEQNITEVNGRNSMLEIMLEDANRLVKFYQTKEKSLIEEKDSLLLTVNKLQQTLQEQCNLRVKNERLKNDMADLKQQNERTAEVGKAEVQRLVREMRAEEGRHKRALEDLRQQCGREAEDAHREYFMEAKDAECKKLLEKKDLDLEDMKKRLKDQEKESQNELLKLQMEFGAKLARVQSSAQWSQQQQQQHGPNLPQSVFKRKLQFFQEEKNKEIFALRQRIKELEENQRASSILDSRPKRRKI